MTLGDVATVRSKNAGPFQITLDVFCNGPDAFQRVRDGLDKVQIARLLQQPVDAIARFDMPDLHVVKFSLARPQVQGSRGDRDMHGAQLAVVLATAALLPEEAAD